MARRPAPIAPGGTFGDLRIETEIGRGAFASVFRAHDTLMDRTVALKILRSAPGIKHADEAKLTLREARLAGRISNPHIVTVYRVHELGHDCWAVEMEYVEGGTLADRLEREGRLPVREVLRILRGILTGLHAAHENGVIHRDIKPANVLLGSRDGAIKLMDFGLSRAMGDATLSISSLDGFIGSPHFVAPEIIAGIPAAPASDLWSVGVLAYQALAGRLPFDAANLPDLFDVIQRADPEPLSGTIPARLRALVHGCLLADAGARPRSAVAMLAALEDVVEEMGSV
jgi:serine/threonine-protein kinase